MAMIPRTLHLKNFLSYSSQTINFEPYNLICLSGKNGHGKSALLDALTWALWGQGRKVQGAAKSDEGLLRLGQTHMMVTLDFSAGGVLYRVRREYTVAGTKATAGLEFGMLDEATGALRPLTDKTIRATQTKINQLVGLDYDSFINSAFLRQGQSQEFSKKTPKERKDILATILGLDRFELVRRSALDKVKEANNLKEISSARLERLKTELSNQPQITEQLTAIDQALAACAGKETDVRTNLNQLMIQNQLIAQQKAQFAQTSFQITHLEKSIALEKEQILSEAARWRHIAREQRNQKEYASIEKEQQSLQKELQEIQIVAARKMQLKEEWLTKKEAARQCITHLLDSYKGSHETALLTKQRIDMQCKSAQEKIQELTKKQTMLKTDRAQLIVEQEKLEKLTHTSSSDDLDAFAKAEAAFERRKAAYHAFLSKSQTLSQNRASVEQKKQLIETADQAQCPLCEQNADKEHLHRKFEASDRLYKHQLERVQRVIGLLKTSLIAEHAALELLKKKGEEHRIACIKKEELGKQVMRVSDELGALEKELELLITLIDDLLKQQTSANHQLETITKALASAHEAESYKAITLELTQLEITLEKIVYNPQRETIVRESIATLSQTISQRAMLIAESARQEERKKLVHQKCAHVIELKKQMRFLGQTLQQLDGYKAAELALKESENKYSGDLAIITKEKEELIHQKGSLEAQVATLKLREQELASEEKLFAVHVQTSDEYTAIAAALSKDGIQALLIEEIIPEIESEANDLLGRLTENQAHLSIESLRDLRSGKTKETLDIKISDAVGVRPYELFSGGEAFRIDFALRIAISKLLARRSGTALQTLIIDEGFGSQDEEGLNHIMESLYTIQDDFAKIIIVSHLPALKEQFPVHFFVTKESDGSSVQVIEHC